MPGFPLFEVGQSGINRKNLQQLVSQGWHWQALCSHELPVWELTVELTNQWWSSCAALTIATDRSRAQSSKYVRLSVCRSVCLSVCQGARGSPTQNVTKCLATVVACAFAASCQVTVWPPSFWGNYYNFASAVIASNELNFQAKGDSEVKSAHCLRDSAELNFTV